MRIVVFSGWAGKIHSLPAADIYICCGNMLPTFIGANDSISDHRKPIYKQAKMVLKYNLREHFGTKDAPVAVCRGQLDFVSLNKLFEGGPVITIQKKSTVFKLGGLTFNGLRGMSNGYPLLPEEMTEKEYTELVTELHTNSDVLITATPPNDILDKEVALNSGKKRSVGSVALASYIHYHLNYANTAQNTSKLKLHCFGKVKQCFGMTARVHDYAKISFVNSEGGYVVLDHEKNDFHVRDLRRI